MSGLFEEYELDLGKETRWHIVSATVAAKSSFLYMQECGHYVAGPGYYTGREGFDSFLMMLTLSGGGEIEYDGKLWRLLPGSICWLDCRKKMKYFTAPSKASWDFLWVHFYGGNARDLYEHFLKQNNNRPETKPENIPTIRNSMQNLIELDNSGLHQFENDIRTQDILMRILSQCILDAMDSHSSEDVPQIVTDIQAYIQLNYTGDCSLQFLGEHFNLNPCYLQKLFKRYMGQTPKDYCSHMRLMQAKYLMRTTNLPVSMIAQEVGIESETYFYRFFRKMEGITPQEYR